MRVSRTWLQKYFDAPLPDAVELARALTFHAFEIENIEGEVLDVKVLPDRAGYALSHRGIASEISAILGLPLARDPLAEPLPEFPNTGAPAVSVEDSLRVPRYMAAKVSGVKVGPSPAWLAEALESVGQRSINNVVDATNYVMLDIGQPLHAFDAARLAGNSLGIRSAKTGETMTVLSGEEYALPAGALVIADGESGVPVGIAGVKGGKVAEITEATTDLVIESACFDGTSVRKAAQSLKLFTDASSRFQNRVSPELAAYGMRDVLALIEQVAGGALEGVVDAYPVKPEPTLVATSLDLLARRLGVALSAADVERVFTRLGLSFQTRDGAYAVAAPFWRRDLQIPEDLSEEVGRILGYDRIAPVELPAPSAAPDQRRFAGIERVRDALAERGFTEISTPSFAASGEVLLSNPLQEEKPYLRADLAGNMREALARAATVAPRVLGPVPAVKLFEIGTVFGKGGERLSLAVGAKVLVGKKSPVLTESAAALSDLLGLNAVVDGDVLELALGEADLEKLGEDFAPAPVSLSAFRPFSLYPSALRDVAVWTPSGTGESEVLNLIMKEAGEYLARIDLFDRFDKDGRTSYAFRLVFESFDKTLSDEELNPAMGRISAALNGREGWQVR